MDNLNKFIIWIEKQQPQAHYKYTGVCLTPGHHKHPQMDSCHPISQHHRFEHRNVMGDVENDEFTDPKITTNEMRTSGDDPGEVLTDITVSPIARAHGIDPSTLLRELRIHFPKISDQMVEEEKFTQDGRPIPYKAIKLTRHQVQWAHDLAQDVYRRKANKAGSVKTVTKEFLDWVKNN